MRSVLARLAARLSRPTRVEEKRDVETVSLVWRSIVLGAVLGVLSLPLVLAYLLLVLTSFSKEVVTGAEILTGRGIEFTLENWMALLSGQLSALLPGTVTADIYSAILNTLLVALGVMVVVVVASTLAGYAFSRMSFRGRTGLMQFIILLHAFPGVALLIGVFMVYRWLLMNIFSSMPGLRTTYVITYTILARAALEVPMSIWLMKGFFDRIPWEVEWSALIDGASRLRVWWEILLPQVKPGIAALAIFSFLAGWEDFVYVYVFMYLGTGGQMYTLATLIEQLVSKIETAELPLVAAAGVLYLLPTLLFFIFTQRFLLEAYAGGVKG